MSPYLKWGCVHPRTLLADLASRPARAPATYRRELAWREFYADVVCHRPGVGAADRRPPARRDAQRRPAATPTSASPRGRRAAPAIPIVDAGMRQLLGEGWMHNRVRMVVASASSSRTCTCRGSGAPGTSCSTSSTATSPRTTTAGSGSPAPAPTPRRSSGSSTRSRRARSSTPTAITSAGSYRSCGTCPATAVHRPWKLPGGIPPATRSRSISGAVERHSLVMRR